ncbi:hypothetical protein A7D00_2703 [Trichophyton violaceum]|uniref:Uncharacterized protein n=1 Tax=Trichophyton violaceum TaxID=34388 RepID=A0A178FK47_TRIVO|nr:hypothetical protein A7D00_2703 [Trichophyton violaceum]
MSWPLSPSTSTSSPLASLPSSPSSRIFHIYNSFPVHYKISDPQKRPLYHVDNSYFTPGTPDLSLYRGEDRKGHLAAVCKFVLFSTCSKIGLMPKPQKSYYDRFSNDVFEIGHVSTSAEDMTWEDLTRESRDHSTYRFEMELLVQSMWRGPELGRRAFVWKRTHSMGVESSKPSKLSACNYKLVDEETGKIMAVIANNGLKSMNKKGKIELFDTAEYAFAGEQLDIMILMTGIALLEKERRRRAQRRLDFDGLYLILGVSNCLQVQFSSVDTPSLRVMAQKCAKPPAAGYLSVAIGRVRVRTYLGSVVAYSLQNGMTNRGRTYIPLQTC